jgi:phosphoglycolate phosphatase-like HAD superfamily hydrolase
MRVISFDIDGTLEVGDPPGTVTLDVVRRAIELGFIVGSCSDRPLGIQRALWEKHGIGVSFTVLKQNLMSVRQSFDAEHYLHIGDSLVDQMMARDSGFDFIHVIEDDLQSALAALRLAS